MKKKKLNSLKLNKKSISNLNFNSVTGGESFFCPLTATISYLFCPPDIPNTKIADTCPVLGDIPTGCKDGCCLSDCGT